PHTDTNKMPDMLKDLNSYTLERIADAHPMAYEHVDGMDVSHNTGDIRAPKDAVYMAHYYLNNRRYELFRETQGNLTGTILTQPRYDTVAINTMYSSTYFGKTATLQIGIPDRDNNEVNRRKDIAMTQIVEWEAAGISVNEARVLEIGGGAGYLSQEVNRRGGHAINIELNQERAEYSCSQGVETYAGMLRDAVENNYIKPNSSDVVACYDLLEHIVDPDVFIKDVRAALKDKGYLTVRVPDTPPEGPTLHLIDHVNHFSRASLIHFMDCNGMTFVSRPKPKESQKSQDSADAYYSGTFSETLNLPEGSKLRPRTIENMTLFFQKSTPQKSGTDRGLNGIARDHTK
ncbi:MAG: class I SAM-dependent methyltransferase, partial [Gammaproteobacteria bacterium]